MRLCVVLGIVGCGAPAVAPVPLPVAPKRCDATAWHAAWRSDRYAWLDSVAPPSGHAVAVLGEDHAYTRDPVLVIETTGGDVRVGTRSAGTIVARWLGKRALGAAVVEPVRVSPRADAPGDPAMRLLPGYRLSATEDGPWLAVRGDGDRGLAFSGVVPAHVRGVIWTVEAKEPRRGEWIAGPIRTRPEDTAPVRATATSTAMQIHGTDGAGWREVTARTPYAEIDGFVAPRPPPPPPRPRPPPSQRGREYDFSEDTIDGELVRPPIVFAAGACLYERPGGQVVGMIVGEAPVGRHERAAEPGWWRLELGTSWGVLQLFTDAPPM